MGLQTSPPHTCPCPRRAVLPLGKPLLALVQGRLLPHSLAVVRRDDDVVRRRRRLLLVGPYRDATPVGVVVAGDATRLRGQLLLPRVVALLLQRRQDELAGVGRPRGQRVPRPPV